MGPGEPARFTRTRLRPGYVIDEVDALVDRIEATLGHRPQAGPPVTAEDVRTARFRTTRLQPGYAQAEVDQALDAYREQLRDLGESPG